MRYKKRKIISFIKKKQSMYINHHIWNVVGLVKNKNKTKKPRVKSLNTCKCSNQAWVEATTEKSIPFKGFRSAAQFGWHVAN